MTEITPPPRAATEPGQKRPALFLPRMIAFVGGLLLALVGGLILLMVLGTPSNDPAGAPRWSDGLFGLAVVAAAVAAMTAALRTWRASVAWACAAGVVAALLACFFVLMA